MKIINKTLSNFFPVLSNYTGKIEDGFCLKLIKRMNLFLRILERMGPLVVLKLWSKGIKFLKKDRKYY